MVKIGQTYFPWLSNYPRRLLTALVLFVLIFSARSVEASLFSSVAKLFGVVTKVDEQTETNSQNMILLQAPANSNPSPLKPENNMALVGGAAVLSESGPNGTVADIKDRPSSNQVGVYVVRGGESLSAIAKMFGVEANTIAWANDLSKNYVPKKGDILTILPVDGIVHTVVKGETLASIAKKYKGDPADIVDYNDLDPNAPLMVGDTIIVPQGQIVSVPGKPAVTVKQQLASKYSGPDIGGYFLRPIAGGRKSQGIHGRNGIDLAVSVGTTVYAAAAGTVTVAKGSGWNGGYGDYIVIRHDNGTETLYSHLSQVKVDYGEKVTRGEVIGATGNTGRSTGAHLHFEVHGAVNPF